MRMILKQAAACGRLSYNSNKVKLSLQFRGREMTPELSIGRINQARDELAGFRPRMAEARHVGRQVTLILSPLPENAGAEVQPSG